MPTYVASRISGNDNAVFPDRLEVDAVNEGLLYQNDVYVNIYD